MEFAIALMVLLVVGTYFIVRPGSTMIDVVEPPVPSETCRRIALCVKSKAYEKGGSGIACC